MKKYSQLALSRSLLLVVCAGCACGDGGATSGDPESSTTGEDTSTSDASSTSGSTAAETTEAGSSEDTGFDTTPPETSSTTDASSSSGSDDASGSSTTTGDDSTTVEVTYTFATQVAGVPLDCASAGTSWVDVAVYDAADPDDTTYDLQDLPCDDTAVSVGPLPPGTYSIGVVAWDQNLWNGSSRDFVVDGSTDPLELEIELSLVEVDLAEADIIDDNACESAGGACVELAPEACDGAWGDATTCSWVSIRRD